MIFYTILRWSTTELKGVDKDTSLKLTSDEFFSSAKRRFSFRLPTSAETFVERKKSFNTKADLLSLLYHHNVDDDGWVFHCQSFVCNITHQQSFKQRVHWTKNRKHERFHDLLYGQLKIISDNRLSFYFAIFNKVNFIVVNKH